MPSKYQGRVDPIELLRNAHTSSKKIRLKDKNLYFDKDIRLPLNTQTAWVSSTYTKKEYSLGSLWLYLEFYLKNITDYMPKVLEYGVDAVNIADRDEIAKYFTGKINDSDCINQELKISLAVRGNNKRDKPPSDDSGEDKGTKKVKQETTLPFELQVIDYLVRFERPTGSKTRSLRCPNKSFEWILNSLRANNEVKPSQSSAKEKIRISTFHEQKRYPLIVVPENLQAGNLSLNNAEKFLVEGVYDEGGVLENPHTRKIEIEVEIRNKKMLFEVTNNPSLLSLSDWDFVVAVFTQGRKSQFNSWAIHDPVALFKKTKGFLLKYYNTQSKEANDWNVLTLILDRHIRYRDSDVNHTIWKEIEDYLYEKV